MLRRNPVIEAIRTRRSVRGYQPGPISAEQLETIVDCGRLAPTAFNEQPWEFVVVRNRDVLHQLATLAPDDGPFIADGSACIVVCGKKDNRSAELDGAAATENMLLGAHALELGACWVQTVQKPHSCEIAKVLNIPATHTLVSMISIGIPFEKTATPPKRDLEEVLHWEKF